MILIPTVNTKAEPSDMFKWELRVQAFQNSVIIAMCNRVGKEDKMKFSGEYILVDACGEVVSKLEDQEAIMYVDIDMAQSQNVRKQKTYTQLRRPELYK